MIKIPSSKEVEAMSEKEYQELIAIMGKETERIRGLTLELEILLGRKNDTPQNSQ